MNTYISPDGWYSLAFSEKWTYVVEENCTTFYRINEGVGALQISAYETDVPQSPKENLIEHLRGENLEVKLEEVGVCSVKDPAILTTLEVTRGTEVVGRYLYDA